MTEKWRIQKWRNIKSGSTKSVPESGRMVDPSISTVTLDKPKVTSILPGPGIAARQQELCSRHIHCPRCGYQTKLVPSKIPRTMETIDRILLECGACGMWYKSSKWCKLEADASIRKWYENKRIDFRRREGNGGKDKL